MPLVDIKNEAGDVTGQRPMTTAERIAQELPLREEQVKEREFLIARYESMIADVNANYKDDPDMLAHKNQLHALIAAEQRQMKMEVLVRDALKRQEAAAGV